MEKKFALNRRRTPSPLFFFCAAVTAFFHQPIDIPPCPGRVQNVSRRPSGAHKQTKTSGKNMVAIQAVSRPCPGHGLASKQSGQKHLLPNQNLVRSCGQGATHPPRTVQDFGFADGRPPKKCMFCSLQSFDVQHSNSEKWRPLPSDRLQEEAVRQLFFLSPSVLLYDQVSSFPGQKARRSSNMFGSCCAWRCFGALGRKSPSFYRVMEAAQ